MRVFAETRIVCSGDQDYDPTSEAATVSSRVEHLATDLVRGEVIPGDVLVVQWPHGPRLEAFCIRNRNGNGAFVMRLVVPASDALDRKYADAAYTQKCILLQVDVEVAESVRTAGKETYE
jgi:hypothetical protein